MTQKATLKIGPLRTRDTPSQERAKIRVQQILQATADLLCQGPVDTLSTTLIARQADIPVSSIYRYFDSIDAIVDELYIQLTEEIHLKLIDTVTRFDAQPGWRNHVRSLLETMRDYFQAHPYYRALLLSVVNRKGAELLDTESSNSVRQHLLNFWRSGGDGFSNGDPEIVANITLQVFIAIENFVVCHVSPEQAEAYFEALSTNLESFLANYLSD